MRSKEELLEKYPYKICNTCKEKLPIEDFYISLNINCGWRIRHECNKCHNISNKKFRLKQKSKGLKYCNKCRLWKPLNMFGKAKMPYSKDGKSYICKECDEKRIIKKMKNVSASKLNAIARRNIATYGDNKASNTARAILEEYNNRNQNKLKVTF